jgi:hypothetical protein
MVNSCTLKLLKLRTKYLNLFSHSLLQEKDSDGHSFGMMVSTMLLLVNSNQNYLQLLLRAGLTLRVLMVGFAENKPEVSKHRDFATAVICLSMTTEKEILLRLFLQFLTSLESNLILLPK